MDKKEARDILVGRIIRLDEALWGVAPADMKFHFHGLRDGAGDVYLFGVSHVSRSCRAAEMESERIMEEVEATLSSMGRLIELESEPESKACLYAPNWIAPVLLTFRQEEDDLLITAYTARTPLFGRIRCRIALGILAWRLPAGITRADKKESKGKTKKEKSAEKPVKAEKPIRAEKTAKAEKSAKAEKPAKPEKTAKPTQKPKRVAPRKKKSAPRRLEK